MSTLVRNRTDELLEALETRILCLDGAMGTMVQALKLDEAAVRGVLGGNILRVLEAAEHVAG